MGWGGDLSNLALGKEVETSNLKGLQPSKGASISSSSCSDLLSCYWSSSSSDIVDSFTSIVSIMAEDIYAVVQYTMGSITFHVQICMDTAAAAAAADDDDNRHEDDDVDVDNDDDDDDNEDEEEEENDACRNGMIESTGGCSH